MPDPSEPRRRPPARIIGALALDIAPHGLFILAWALWIPSIASFLGMNFTGASTYTSLSGVLKEMRHAIPEQSAGAILGVGLWITSLFL